MSQNLEITEIKKRFMQHVVDAHARLDKSYEDYKLLCTNTERANLIDDFKAEAFSMLETRNSFINSLFKRYDDEMDLLRAAFKKVGKLEDMLAKEFLFLRHQTNVEFYLSMESEFVKNLDDYVLGQGTLLDRLMK